MTSPINQRSLAELRSMSVEQIRDAYSDGELAELLGGKDPAQLTRENLKNMRHDEINEAPREGRLDQLLGRR